MADLDLLRRLKVATDCAIEKTQSEDLKGAINWADLHCLEAQFVVADDGREWYRVLIEEAAPDYGPFHLFIQKELNKAGFGYVEVSTEW